MSKVMTKDRPNVRPAGRYTITEVSELLGISRQHVTRLAKTGAIRYGIRKSNGRKFITGLELLRVWQDHF